MDGLKSTVLVNAPGRVNLLGEHVDYNGGMVLPVAIDRAVRLRARVRDDGQVSLRALSLHEEVIFRLADLDQKLDINGKPLPSWALYPAGVAWALREAGCPLRGIEGEYDSDVPVGSGLSSSAAVEVAFGALWQHLGGWQASRMDLARLCQRAENQYVGVNCGLMDQFASAHGVAGCALYFDTRSLEWRPVPLPPGMAIVIANSGVHHSLAASAYNDRRQTCEQALELLQKHLPHIRSLRDVSPQEFYALEGGLPVLVAKRARHIVEECARVVEAARLLEAGDGQGFGRLMYAGHASMRDLYEASCPELDALVEIAAGLPGCLGARLTGAGFGGCTVNLVESAHVIAFVEALKKGYAKRSDHKAEIYICQASAGVRVEEGA